MVGITFGGLATGLDTNAIISALVGVRQVSITRMESKKAGYQTQVDAFKSFKEKLETLQEAAADLKEVEGFNVFKTTSSIEGVLTATTSDTALTGTYTIEVSDLATNHQIASQNFADKGTTSFGEGTLTVSVGGVDTDITIESDDSTLEDIAAAINASDAEVTASVVDDGSGTPYRLVLMSDESGEANQVSLDTIGLTGGDASLSMSTVQEGTDAHFTVNGIPMQRASNEAANVVEGLSLTLTGTTEANQPVQLSVERDAEGLTEKFNAFVTAYNSVASFINGQNTYSETKESGGALMGDSMLATIQSKLHGLLVPDWEETGPEVQLLTQAGIEFENDGTLSLDETELEEALANNFDDVVAMFSSEGIGDQIDDLLEHYTKFAGSIDSKQDSIERIMRDLDRQIASAEDRLDDYEAQLLTKYASLEQLMSSLNAQQSYVSAYGYGE